jgi:hypothetical protein
MATALVLGDTIVFRRGVAYRGEIKLKASDTRDNPITLDRNTAGKFGNGRVIYDGGQVIKS